MYKLLMGFQSILDSQQSVHGCATFPFPSHCAVSVLFLCLALIANVWRFHSCLLVYVHRILSAVLAPMPPVIRASPNILHHVCSQVVTKSLPVFFSYGWVAPKVQKSANRNIFNKSEGREPPLSPRSSPTNRGV